MVFDDNNARTIARELLQIKAIQLNPTNPFTWASGWHSPIYCDNRKTLSYPTLRNHLRDSFAAILQEAYPATEVIAGVATAGIAHGALLADVTGLPFIYVRSKPKDHGMQNLIEGVDPSGKNVLMIEDLISTGGSSLHAVEAIRNAGGRVMGLAAIFTYGFEAAEVNFHEHNCTNYTLSDYQHLLEEAVKEEYVSESELNTLEKWRVNPAGWAEMMGH